MSRFLSLTRNLFRKAQVEKDLDHELRSYVDLLADEKAGDGVEREEARRQALLELEGVEQVKERVREVRTGRLLEQTLQDLRFGLRTLPGAGASRP